MEQLRDDAGGLVRDSAAARAELQAAKARVLANPASLELRLELAEAYRVRGFPDQAGRWGILSEGWPTDLELDRLARMLAVSGTSATEVRTLLLLPESADLPPALTALLSGQVAAYRARPSRAAAMAMRVVEAAGLTALCAFVGTLLIVFVLSLFGTIDPTGVARVGGIATVAFTVIALGAGGLAALTGRRSSPPSE